MGGPRNATLQVSRPLQFRPFTSVSTPAQDTKTPEFEFAIPRQDETHILLTEAKWPTRRFVYVFFDRAVFNSQGVEDETVDFWLGAAGAANPLVVVVRVEPSGKQAICLGFSYKLAIEGGREVKFDPVSELETVGLEPELFRDQARGTYAVAAPILLPLEAIAKLEESRPREVPILGTGMGIGVDGDETPANARWVFPIVDPLLIAENLARKFFEAADNFLSASQQIDRPPARNEDEKNAREQGELLRLKKTIADNLVALKSAAPSLASTFEETLQSGFPESFLSEYRESLDELVFQRELAAFQLIAWLESDLFVLADDWWDRKGGKPDEDYEAYVRVVLDGLSRLAEADRGIQYLMDVLGRTEAGSSPAPPGVIHVTGEFVFPSTASTAEVQTIATKSSTKLFSAWSAFVTASLAVRQRVLKAPNRSATLIDDMRAFANRLAFALGIRGLLEIDIDNIPLERPAPAGTKKIVINIPVPSFRLGPGRTALSKLRLTTTHVSRVCSVINFGLALAALRTALEESGDERARNMAFSGLAGAGLGIVDKGLALPVLESFRNKLGGKVNMGSVLFGNRVASTLGLLGAVASLSGAAFSTAEAYDRGDWDKAVAHMTEGFGAILTGVGSTVILVSGTTGPFALWTLLLGAGIGAAGYIWSVFAADSEIEQMLKFCAFGKQSGEAAIKPPGWSQCSTTFAQWDSNKPDGLIRQLTAFQQIFFSFDASGADSVEAGPLASDGILRITPASLRLSCTFEIEYTAVYSVPGVTAPGGGPRTLTGKGRVVVPSTAGDAPVFVDDKNNYQSTGAVRVHKDDGRDAIDVRFRLIVPMNSRDGRPLELQSLQCAIQLRVPGMKVSEVGGDDALIVPTTAKGAKSLTVNPVKQGIRNFEVQLSVKVA
jgi:hypothetical protein